MRVDELAARPLALDGAAFRLGVVAAGTRVVSCFYADAEDATLLIDPLLPRDDADRFWNRSIETSGGAAFPWRCC